MKFKQAKTTKVDLMVADLPHPFGIIGVVGGIKYNYYGVAEDLTEEECAKLVAERKGYFRASEDKKKQIEDTGRTFYRDYSKPPMSHDFLYTAKASLITLLQSLGVNDDWKNRRIYVRADGIDCNCPSCKQKRHVQEEKRKSTLN